MIQVIWELEGKRQTSNYNIVITVLHCGIVNIITIHIRRALAVVHEKL